MAKSRYVKKRRSMKKKMGGRTPPRKTYKSRSKISRKSSMPKARKAKITKKGKRKTYRKKSRKVMRGG